MLEFQLKKIQETELEILNVVHEFCKENKIQYSLTYGTLIGAVRHQGFIPWDDDIDLMMMRDQYDKFIRLWRNNPPKGYFLQNDITDPSYGNNFLKIRKKGTAFIQSEKEKNVKYHTGIFIDIFPVDRVAPEGIARKTQYFACLINMLLTRNHPSEKKGLNLLVERIILGLPYKCKAYLKEKTYNYKIKWNKRRNLPLFWNGTVYGAHTYFIPDLFDNMTNVSFEGKEFLAYKKYDRFLKDYFGNYMELPPEDKRVTHHPIIVYFDREYHNTDRRNKNA